MRRLCASILFLFCASTTIIEQPVYASEPDQSVVATTRAERKLARSRRGGSKIRSFRQVCAQVKNVTGSEFLYKSEISSHIPRGDARAAGPTLICNRMCPKRFPASLFYSDGSLAAKVGYYGRWNVTGKTRAYCAAGGAPACNVRALASDARRRGRDGSLYLQMSRSTEGKGTLCYRVRPLGRTGSPK
jgi:hypothetical protein